METKKYKIRKDLSYTFDGHKLYRVEALKDFGDVKKGSIGGFIEKEDNLSQEGNCWVYLDAKVFGNAEVSGNAVIDGFAQVCDNANLGGTCLVRENAIVCGDADIYEFVHFNSDAKIKSPADYYVGRENWEGGHNFVYTRSNNKWSTFFINGTKEEILEFAKKKSERYYNFYKNVIEFVEKLYS